MTYGYPLHLIAETTPGMHPWETLPGDYYSVEDAVAAAWEYHREHGCRLHVNDLRANFLRAVPPHSRVRAEP